MDLKINNHSGKVTVNSTKMSKTATNARITDREPYQFKEERIIKTTFMNKNCKNTLRL